tara:strand:- start:552 stop:824 length:273 start_codon:yes stop_codon:yes gene_type:complete
MQLTNQLAGRWVTLIHLVHEVIIETPQDEDDITESSQKLWDHVEKHYPELYLEDLKGDVLNLGLHFREEALLLLGQCLRHNGIVNIKLEE